MGNNPDFMDIIHRTIIVALADVRLA
jgi:hypothetical protein